MEEKESFLKLAKTKGFLTEEHLQKCVFHWENLRIEGVEKKIWDVARDLGFLSEKHHERIAEHMTFISLREADKQLGAVAVSSGLVQSTELEIALILQRKTHRDDKKVRRLEEILLEMEALKPEDVEAFRRGEGAAAPEQPGITAEEPVSPLPAGEPSSGEKKASTPPEDPPPTKEEEDLEDLDTFLGPAEPKEETGSVPEPADERDSSGQADIEKEEELDLLEPLDEPEGPAESPADDEHPAEEGSADETWA